MVIFQRCCRIDGIRNITPNVNVGASYFCQIQGTNSIGTNGVNSNPDFGIKDTVLICQGKRFKLDYSATDAEGDSLTYEFSPGYYGGGTNNAVVTNPGPPSSWAASRIPDWLFRITTPGSQCYHRPKNRTHFRCCAYQVVIMWFACWLKNTGPALLVSSHRKDFIISCG